MAGLGGVTMEFNRFGVQCGREGFNLRRREMWDNNSEDSNELTEWSLPGGSSVTSKAVPLASVVSATRKRFHHPPSLLPRFILLALGM